MTAGLLAGTASAQQDAPVADRTNPTISSGKAERAAYALREGRKTTVVFEIKAQDNAGVTAVGARVFAAGKTSASRDPFEIVHLKRASGTAKNGVWRGTLELAPGAPTGKWVVRGIAFDAENNCTCYGPDEGVEVLDTFLIRAKTRMTSVQAVPNPEKRGYVTVAAVLEAITRSGWRGLERMTVIVEFRPSGASSWQRVGEATRDGSIYYGSYPEKRSGEWRSRFAATNRYTGVTSKPVAVAKS